MHRFGPGLLCPLLLLLGAPAAAAQSLVVQRVVDGDTFEVYDPESALPPFRVRLLGIDTPERRASPKLRSDADRIGVEIAALQALGEEAMYHAVELVIGRGIALEYDPAYAAAAHKDPFGRTLAYVHVLDEAGQRLYSVNERMLRDGYATVFTDHRFGQKGRFARLEYLARQAERGFWAKEASNALSVTDLLDLPDSEFPRMDVSGPVPVENGLAPPDSVRGLH